MTLRNVQYLRIFEFIFIYQSLIFRLTAINFFNKDLINNNEIINNKQNVTYYE